MGLSADVKKFAKMAKDKQLKVVKVSLFATFNGSIIRSPVGNPDLWKYAPPPNYVGGQFRANWRMTIGSIDGKIKDTENKGEALSSLSAGIGSIKIGDTGYFTNPMPYGPSIEYDAWSSQAPDGVVRVEVKNFQKNVDKAIRATR